MSKNPRSFLNGILYLGIKEDMPFVHSQKNFMFNLFILIALPFAFISLAINLGAHEYPAVAINVLQIIIFFSGLIISYTQKFLHLRPLMLILVTMIGIANAYFFKNGSEYRLLIMIIAAIIIFDEIWQYLLFALMASIAFVYVRMIDLPLSGMELIDIYKQIVQILLPLIFLVVCLYYFKTGYSNYQNKLERAYKQLALAKEQKDRILNAVAHDLRTPISGISGMSKLLLLDTQLNEDQLELIRLIDRTSDNSISLINDLLQKNLKDTDSFHFHKEDFNEIVNEAVKSLRFNAAEKNIDIVVELSSIPLFVEMDKNKIDRVISNLVTNAIKFSYQNSSITVRLYKEHNKAVLVIKDNGVGIPAYKKDQVFDIFTTAKQKGTDGEESFGLGLSICKEIIDVHEGSIYVESEQGKGTSFFVKLMLIG